MAMGHTQQRKAETMTITKEERRSMLIYPYIPGRPEWASVPWVEAREIDPRVDGFLGYTPTAFIFQVRGICEVHVPRSVKP